MTEVAPYIEPFKYLDDTNRSTTTTEIEFKKDMDEIREALAPRPPSTRVNYGQGPGSYDMPNFAIINELLGRHDAGSSFTGSTLSTAAKRSVDKMSSAVKTQCPVQIHWSSRRASS